MTIAAAVAQIISTIEATTPSTLGGTLATGKFRHLVESTAESVPDTRGFWVMPTTLGNVGPFRARHIELTLEVSVYYRTATNAHKLGLAIADDYAKISAAVMSPSNWSPQTTGIRTLTRGEPMIPATITSDATGRTLTMTITAEVQP